MVVIPAAIEGVAVAASLLPFIIHRWDMYRWSKEHTVQHHPKGQEHQEELTVLLPLWNEAVILEKKLQNLASQELPFRLLIIDSASTDDTVKIAKDWLNQHPTAFTAHEVIEMPERKGKTPAVIQALEHIGQHHKGLVCMTDADAMLPSGTLTRMMQWFTDPMVGAVGALPERVSARQEEEIHRASWDNMRLAESMVDSTPFLEGSCMMWRQSCLPIDELYPKANADDAQIATAIRCRGWRTVADPMASFRDVAPISGSEQRRQKVRRAQGLQRLLVRQRKNATSRQQGTFGRIFRRQFHFHITAPLLLAIACLTALLRWAFIGLYGWPATFTLANSLHLGLTLIEALCLVLWWRGRNGKPSGPLSLLGQWFSSMELLARSLIKTARGTSLHMWDQHTETREELLRRER